MQEIVSTKDLKRGMFVAELDRPWTDTPFLLQGVLLERDDQIEVLRRLCDFVSIDRSRSVGLHHAAQSRFQPPVRSRRGPVVVRHPDEHAGRVESPSFLDILRALRESTREEERQSGATRRRRAVGEPIIYADAASVAPETDDEVLRRLLKGESVTQRRHVYQVPVEEEIAVSADLYQHSQDLVVDLAQQMSADKLPDLDRIGEAVDGMVRSVARNPDALIWLSRLKRTDNYTYDHVLDVSVHLMAFGRHLGLALEELRMLGVAGLMQDIGKMKVPIEILHKPGPLTRAERLWINRHVDYSMEMLGDYGGIPDLVREIVGKHHERIDGSGYPKRLKAGEIGLYGEMAGLVDSYCAMSYARTFRAAIDSQRSLEEVNAMRGKLFSESTADEFVQCMGLYPVGTLVELNSGEVAVVAEQNRMRRLKPRLVVLLGPDKTPNRAPGILNLLTDPMIRDGLPYRIVRALPAGTYGVDPREFYL